MTAEKTIQSGKYVAQIFQDENPDSPRNWDNLGTMVCFHNRYNLGDMEKRYHGKGENTFSSREGFHEWYSENESEIAVILPLFLYDHSGLSISTGSFHDVWDSGQIGYIFVTKEDLKKEHDKKICTKKMKEDAEKVLESEVKTYDEYLRGYVYGYRLFEIDPEFSDQEFEDSDNLDDYGKEIDSCWGFFGMDYVTEEVGGLIKFYQEKK